MSLAKTLKGDIIAVDLFEEFLEKLKENSAKENTTANNKPPPPLWGGALLLEEG